MEFYSKLWTQFETQSLAFGILRKNLYPKYLVRGYNGYINILRPTENQFKPEKVLTIHVTASDSKAQCGFFQREDKTEFLLVGGDGAYKINEFIKPYLPE